MIQRTKVLIPSLISFKNVFDVSAAMLFNANPNRIDQNKILKYCPSAKASTGFMTTVFNKLVMTSPMPPGAAVSCAAFPVNTKVCGKVKLTVTATIAAKKVLIIYKKITRPNRLSIPVLDDAKELVINTNTRTGAIERRAPLNRSPKMPIGKFLNKTPKIVPMIKPITMRRIKLVSLYFRITFIFLSPYS